MDLVIHKVLISEPVDPQCSQILVENGFDVTTKIGLSKDQLIAEIKGYDGLIVRSATKVTADVIASGKELKLIGRAGVGVDNIDCNAATRNGVLVINAPGGNTLSAAELTCGMVVSLSRHIPKACASLKSGKWDRKNFMGTELQGKTLAIIGLGRIGREVAHRMQAYGMTTIGFDPLVPGEVSKEFGVESMDLETIWPLADYITVHTPLIPQTKNLINDAVLSKCRPGVKIINCARGGIVDEDALLRALQSGHCGGAGLDVFLEEPPKNTELIQHPNLICTPHLGASTVEAQSRVAVEIAYQFIDIKEGRSPHGIVNAPPLGGINSKIWIAACKYLGAIAATLFPETAKEMSLQIIVNGLDLNQMTKLFKTSVLIGVLKQKFHVPANFVNALALASEKGIEVTEVRVSPPMMEGSMPVSLLVVATCSEESHTLLATFKGDEPVLCAIDGMGFHSQPVLTDNLVLCRRNHTTNTTFKNYIGTLMEEGIMKSASFSTIFENCSWCVISTSCKLDNMLQSASQDLEFCTQLNL